MCTFGTFANYQIINSWKRFGLHKTGPDAGMPRRGASYWTLRFHGKTKPNNHYFSFFGTDASFQTFNDKNWHETQYDITKNAEIF